MIDDVVRGLAKLKLTQRHLEINAEKDRAHAALDRLVDYGVASVSRLQYLAFDLAVDLATYLLSLLENGLRVTGVGVEFDVEGHRAGDFDDVNSVYDPLVPTGGRAGKRQRVEGRRIAVNRNKDVLDALCRVFQ